MSKEATYSSAVVERNERYLEILKCKKRIESASIELCDESSHAGVLQKMVCVHRVDDGAEMLIDVRGHFRNIPEYSFRIFDKSFMGCAIGRMDIVGSPHDNLNMGFRLSEIRVETPHFHKFHRSGYECAYKTPHLLRTEVVVRKNRSAGLRCFLDEENVEYDTDPELSVGDLFQPDISELDPLQGVSFQ